MTSTDIALRLAASLIAGIILGLEREKRGRAAGLRTTTLVCVSSCAAMMLSELLPGTANLPPGTFAGDPGRLAAGVLTGMGFLGAGVIIRQDTLIRGVTTAAVLWLTCIVGLTLGSGHFGLGAASLAIALFILLGLPFIERHMDNDGYIRVEVAFTGNTAPLNEIAEILKRHHVRPLTTGVSRGPDELSVSIHATSPSRDSLELPDQVTRALRALPGATSARWTC